MTTNQTWWSAQNDMDLADSLPRPRYVGDVARSVRHIHALVRIGYHPKFVEEALRDHLGKHGMKVKA